MQAKGELWGHCKSGGRRDCRQDVGMRRELKIKSKKETRIGFYLK